MRKTSFVLNTFPYNVCVRGAPPSLYRQLTHLYPSSLLLSDASDVFTDFVVDFDKNGRFWSNEYDFRLSGNHFRYATEAIAVPIFEWGFNWLATSFSTRYLSFHAAVVEKNGVAVVLPAPPGSGKSTMCALMMLHGWRLLSDEHCYIDRTSGLIVPFVRPVSLKNNSIDVIGRYDASFASQASFDDTLKGRMKYLAPTPVSWSQATTPAKAGFVIFPRYVATRTQLEITTLPEAELFMAMLQNSFNFTVFGEEAFDLLADFTGSVQAYTLEYSDNSQMLAWVETLVNACP